MYSQCVAFVIDNRMDVLQCIASYVVIALLYRPYKNKTISVDHGMTTQLISATVPAITSYVEFDENGKMILGNYDKVAIQLLICNQLTAWTNLHDQCMHAHIATGHELMSTIVQLCVYSSPIYKYNNYYVFGYFVVIKFLICKNVNIQLATHE